MIYLVLTHLVLHVSAKQLLMIQQMLAQNRANVENQGVYSRRDISNDAEGRGILRSGELERNLAEQMQQEQQLRSQSEASLREELQKKKQEL